MLGLRLVNVRVEGGTFQCIDSVLVSVRVAVVSVRVSVRVEVVSVRLVLGLRWSGPGSRLGPGVRYPEGNGVFPLCKGSALAISDLGCVCSRYLPTGGRGNCSQGQPQPHCKSPQTLP